MLAIHKGRERYFFAVTGGDQAWLDNEECGGLEISSAELLTCLWRQLEERTGDKFALPLRCTITAHDLTFERAAQDDERAART